jgi:hypothetical protein
MEYQGGGKEGGRGYRWAEQEAKEVKRYVHKNARSQLAQHTRIQSKSLASLHQLISASQGIIIHNRDRAQDKALVVLQSMNTLEQH